MVERDGTRLTPLSFVSQSSSVLPRYKFATSVNAVRTPSLIPEAHLSVLPYLALPPHLLRSRAVELQDETAIFGMTFYPNGLAEGQEREDEEMVADGLIGIRNTDFVVGYMSPRWRVRISTLIGGKHPTDPKPQTGITQNSFNRSSPSYLYPNNRTSLSN